MTHARRVLITFYLLALFLLVSSPTYAQTIFVTVPDDSDATGTLRNVIATAAPGSIIELADALKGSPFTLNLDTAKGPLVIDKNLTIDTDNVLTINAPNGFAAISVLAGVTFNLNQMEITVQATNTTGITSTNANIVNLDSVRITGNNSPTTTGIQANGGAVLGLNSVNITGMNNNAGPGAVLTNGVTQTSISNSDFTQNTGTTAGGLSFTGGTVTLEGNEIYNNTGTGAGSGGGVTFGGTTLNLTRTAVSTNQGVAATNVNIVSGSVNAVNTTIGQGQGAQPAYLAGAGTTSNISFSTIAQNTGPGISSTGTVNLDSVIVHSNLGGQCTGGGTFSLNNFNIIQDTSCGTNSLLLQTDPLLTPIPATGGVLLFQLAPNSPALNRAVGCPVSNVDIENIVRVLNADTENCDIGSDERSGANDTRGTITASAVGSGRVQEGTTNAVTLSYNIDIIQVPNVNISLLLSDNNGQCLINGNATATLNLTPTQQSVSVTARDDLDAEGIHECEIVGTVTAVNGTYADGLYDEITAPVRVIPVDDDADTPVQPTVLPFDITNFTVAGPFGSLMAEGDPARNLLLSLDGPPRGTATFNFSDGSVPNECIPPITPVTITAENFQSVPIPILAQVDSEREGTGEHQCAISAVVTFSAPGVPNETTTTATVTFDLAADPPQRLQFYNDQIDPDVLLTTVTLREGETFPVGLKTLFPIPTGSAEVYNVSLNVFPKTGSAPGITQCTLTPNPVTLNEANAIPVVTLSAVADGVEENLHGCTVTMTVLAGSTDLTVLTSTLDVTIFPDPVANPALVIENQDDGSDPLTTSPSVAEGGADVVLDFSLVQDATAPVTIGITETARTPDQPTAPNQQCVIKDENDNVINSLVLSNANSFSDELHIAAFDDFIEETAAHSCTLTITRAGFANTTITVNINDNDILSVYTLPNMAPPGVGVEEGTFVRVDYNITRNSNQNFVIAFTGTDQPCLLYPSPSTNQSPINALTIAPQTTVGSVYLFAPNNGQTEPNRFCQYTATLNSADTAYTNQALSNTDVPTEAEQRDVFVPDINAVVRDIEVIDTNPDATATPIPSGALTPTPVPGNEATADAIAQEQANNQANAEAAEAALPTATPIPDPYLVLAADVDRLPVRTGPYLGASLVTIALRDDSPDGPGDVQYEIIAKNRDETPLVYWYFISVNGREGWVSGRSVNVDLDGDGIFDLTPESFTETLEGDEEGGETFNTAQFDRIPFAGSVFDDLGNAPDLGVTVTLVRDRLLHRRPSRRAEIIGGLNAGTQASLIGRTREIDIDDWYQVRVGGVVGWIESDTNLAEPAVIVDRELVRDRVPVR